MDQSSPNTTVDTELLTLKFPIAGEPVILSKKCYTFYGFTNTDHTEQTKETTIIGSAKITIFAEEYCEFLKMRGTQQIQLFAITSFTGCISRYGNNTTR